MNAEAHHDEPHDYHLVDPSPWPAVGSFAAFFLFFGVVLYLHPGMLGEGLEKMFAAMGIWVFIPGLIGVLATMWVWWRDVIREATVEGHHKPVVQLGLRYGMMLFIASEVMFFAAFFWAFFDASLYFDEAQQYLRVESTGGVWPPKGTETFDPFDVPFMNTLVLLLSGCTVTWAHHALREGNQKDLIQGLAYTVILGIIFTGLQAYEYVHATFTIDGGIYGSTFYMATGFHGFHVIVGTTFLAVCYFRARKGHFKPDQHFGLEAAAWYWHFVDVVWLFLFCCIYWWGG
ncbi:MAG TPA: cytochrome c oxidase subunit 3 [Rhodospirillaceae bacterium]|nr:cytochrome c oxidase subunit 3 [Rhodospirillaceae bacterium]HAT36000.1 cytochrome c oxidase subunit 3 [Rhodospirillaceae bacterium]